MTGVRTPQGGMPADAVISTMPTPLVSALVPALPEDWKAKYDGIDNIGVCCLVFKLKRSVTPHFWVNIVDPASKSRASSSSPTCGRWTRRWSMFPITCP